MRVALLLLAACLPPSTLRTRGMTPAASTESVLQEALAPRRVALLVGIDRYDDPMFGDLRHAAADATALAELLRQPDAGFDTVQVLGPAVGRDEVLTTLRRLGEQVRRDDELLLYFAGHGTRAEVDGEPRRYLLTTDTRTPDLVSTAVDLDAMLDWVRQLPPLRRGVIVDACFDGGGRSVVAPAGGPLGAPLRAARLGPGDIEVLATTPGRPALEDDGVGHGVYTWYLLEAASWAFQKADRDDDGVLTLWEAHDHARGQVIVHTGGVQVPEAMLRTVGEADVVLRGTSEQRRERDAALFYLYPEAGSALSGATVEVDGQARGALPGTFVVEAGRRQVRVIDAEGRVIADGWLNVGRGRALRVDQLMPTLTRERGGVAVMAVAAGAPGLGEAAGPAAGVGIRLDGRLAALPWFQPGVHLDLLTADSPEGARALLGGGVQVAAVWEHERAMASFGWGVTGWWIPAREVPVGVHPLEAPALAGWRFVATGPRVGLDLAVGRGWWVAGGLVVEGTGLVLEPEGEVRFVPIVTGGIGVRAGF